ncbi:hypothetical protein BD413DRAFT_484729 [Trametes elegans]|nr:hypothetical protein BD413DRAFT_484729 [Trametes elegans]
MVAQLTVPGQSPGPSHHETLQPFAYNLSNTSKSSGISIGVQSTSTGREHRSARADVSRHRPEARPTSRAAARGISRVASRAPSRATSRSRSRAPSPSPLRSHIDLPNATVIPPPPSGGSQNTLALPETSTIPPTPESLPPVSVQYEEKLWTVLTIPRYDDCPTITPERADWLLEPVTLSFPTEGVPPDWTACTHPEGRLYFYHSGKRIFTDADVRDRKIKATLQAFEEVLESKIREQNLILPTDYELVLYLEERKISGGYNWLYYYVDHSTRSLFWVQEMDIIEEISEIGGIKQLSEIRNEIEAKYWLHCELYPYKHTIPEDVFADLSGMLVFASVDVVTSLTSTVTYRPDDVHRMVGLVKAAKAVAETQYATVVIARLMHLFLHQRYLNLYGQTHARLARDQSVYNTQKHSKTPLIILLAPLFWNAPHVHMRGLEKIWIDGIIVIQPWSSFIGKLQNEWQEFILYSTVLLNANVAFLAIPSVDTGTGQLTAAQISSYLSIVTSVGSILLGLLLIRQHRVKSRDTADEAWRFLSSRKHQTLGLETLAIIYSLPYALLMWGMVTFLLAFSFECFGTSDMVSVYATSGAWVAVALLVFWCVFTGWESGETSVWDRPKEWWARLFPEQDEGTTAGGRGSLAAGSMSEKTPRRWLARALGRVGFPHSSDPPLTEMHERASSTV